MAAKANYVLDATSAAIIGVNDELRALYLNIQNIYDEVREDLESSNPNIILWPQKLEETAYGRIRKTIDDLLPGITTAFTDEYTSLNSNKSALKGLGFLKFEPRTLQISYISYAEFLQKMQDFIVRIILQRKRYKFSKISLETVENAVVRHIKDTVAKKQTEQAAADESGTSRMFKEMIIVFENLSAISCNLNDHIVEPARVPVPLLTSSTLVMLPIHHCITCDRYFVGSETLKIYEELYGRLFIRVIREDADSSEFSFFGESELHRTGYNVRKDGMTTAERRSFLAKLITNKIMSEFAVCRDIEKAIRIFDGRMEYVDAVAKWKDDLAYVSNKYGGRIIEGQH